MKKCNNQAGKRVTGQLYLSVMKKISILLILIVSSNLVFSLQAQTKTDAPVFREIEMLLQNGDNVDEKSVEVTFLDSAMVIKSKNDAINKTFLYSDIKAAEYSYSKSPRWKTGLGLGAAAFLFPPLFFVAIPLGFTKHRRHWVTIKTETDYAVLKLSKSTRKIFVPTFETKTGVTIQAVGEEK